MIGHHDGDMLISVSSTLKCVFLYGIVSLVRGGSPTVLILSHIHWHLAGWFYRPVHVWLPNVMTCRPDAFGIRYSGHYSCQKPKISSLSDRGCTSFNDIWLHGHAFWNTHPNSAIDWLYATRLGQKLNLRRADKSLPGIQTARDHPWTAL